VPYWWDGNATEHYWVEIRKVPGIGTSLYCPDADDDGGVDPWYELVSSVARGDVIYHWNAREHRFVGRSIAAESALHRRREGAYVVELEQFTPLETEVALEDVRAIGDALYTIRDDLLAQFGAPLLLPFQYKRDRSALAFMSNYFAKLPADIVELFFGADGLAQQGLPVLPVSPGNGAVASTQAVPPSKRSFLQPFKPKADTSYLRNIEGGRRTHPRSHETLVNNCAEWLAAAGYVPGRNAAVDLGLENPPVVIEAKVVGTSWATSVREAVGQLYEYRYFKVADPQSALVFLANQAVPNEWVRYLERDRQIGVMWPSGRGFHLSKLAARAIKL
jgi:hypothetical protein